MNTINAQEKNQDLLLFGEGMALITYVNESLDNDIENLDTTNVNDKLVFKTLFEQKENILENSLEYFETLINDFPKSKLRYRSINNAAFVSMQLEYDDDAIKYFKKMINSKANDKEKGGVGDGLMQEPYALYKNRACINLAKIYIKDNKYSEAIKYLDLTKKYPYQHFCGNEYAWNDIRMAILYTNCYLGLNDNDKALNTSLSEVFYTGLADNNEIFDLVCKIIKNNFSIDEIKNELELALNSITIKHKKRYDIGIIKLFGKKLELISGGFYYGNYKGISNDEFDKLPEIEQYKHIFKTSKIYEHLYEYIQ
jgi:hypothetical protein